MARSDRSIGIYLTLVFLAGIGLGAGGFQLYRGPAVIASGQVRKSPEDYRREYLEEMKSRLNLDAHQVAKLEVILEETHGDFKRLRERTKPEVQRIQQEQIDAVNALLKEEQKQEYKEMRAEREVRRKARGDSF